MYFYFINKTQWKKKRPSSVVKPKWKSFQELWSISLILVEQAAVKEKNNKLVNKKPSSIAEFPSLSGFADWYVGGVRGWFWASGGYVRLPLSQMERACTVSPNHPLLAQVGMCAHALIHHFPRLFPNNSRPGSGAQPGDWGPLLYFLILPSTVKVQIIWKMVVTNVPPLLRFSWFQKTASYITSFYYAGIFAKSLLYQAILPQNQSPMKPQ